MNKNQSCIGWMMETWWFSKINLKINIMASGDFRYMTTESV